MADTYKKGDKAVHSMWGDCQIISVKGEQAFVRLTNGLQMTVRVSKLKAPDGAGKNTPAGQ